MATADPLRALRLLDWHDVERLAVVRSQPPLARLACVLLVLGAFLSPFIRRDPDWTN